MSDEARPKDEKPHRVSKRGRKAEKKKASKAGKAGQTGSKVKRMQISHIKEAAEQQNPKAFAFNSGTKAQKQAQTIPRGPTKETACSTRGQDTHNIHHPMIVAVVGPPGCGKSSLIRSLVKKYTKTNITRNQGTNNRGGREETSIDTVGVFE